MAKLVRISVASLAASAFALSAFADQVGSVTAATGEADQVIVVRGNETFSLTTGDVIFEGDQIITRSGGTAEISIADCTRQLGNLEAITVDGDFCTKAIASVDPSGTSLRTLRLRAVAALAQHCRSWVSWLRPVLLLPAAVAEMTARRATKLLA